MGIPETGYGSWPDYYVRRDVARKAGKSGGGVHCEHSELLPCEHFDDWAHRHQSIPATHNPEQERRVARG